MMKYIFEAILFVYFVAAFANSAVKPTTKTTETKKALCNVNNYNSFYAGQKCKNIEQHLAKINEGIEALKGNKTGGTGENGLSSQVRQQLIEIKQEIRALKENQTSTGEKGLSSEMKQQFAEIKQEIRAFKGNHTGGAGGNGLSGKMKQQLVEIKQEMRALKKKTDWLFRCKSVQKLRRNLPIWWQEKWSVHQNTAGGGWTVFQKRYDGSVDFFRGWENYKRGFGNLNGEFWLGLDKIHRLTVNSSNQLHVDLEDVHGRTAYADYSYFAVANETEKYRLSLGRYYSGTAGDSFSRHRGLPFSTKDRDNDRWAGGETGNCAFNTKGAWWYYGCHRSNLNGLYIPGRNSGQGMAWYSWKKSWIAVKRSEMKIRSLEI